jgi:hypothetical protein
MPPGNRGMGGVPIPPRHHQQSRPEIDPLSALADDPDMHLRFRAAAEVVCGEAIEKARGAESKETAIDGKLNLLLGIAGTTLAACLGAFVWLFQQQQGAASEAREMAQRVAKTVVLESREDMLRTLRSERDETARQAAKAMLEEQSRVFASRKDPDVVTVAKAR